MTTFSTDLDMLAQSNRGNRISCRFRGECADRPICRTVDEGHSLGSPCLYDGFATPSKPLRAQCSGTRDANAQDTIGPGWSVTHEPTARRPFTENTQPGRPTRDLSHGTQPGCHSQNCAIGIEHTAPSPERRNTPSIAMYPSGNQPNCSFASIKRFPVSDGYPALLGFYRLVKMLAKMDLLSVDHSDVGSACGRSRPGLTPVREAGATAAGDSRRIELRCQPASASRRSGTRVQPGGRWQPLPARRPPQRRKTCLFSFAMRTSAPWAFVPRSARWRSRATGGNARVIHC